MISAILLLAAAAVLTFIFTWPLIWVLNFYHLNQAIREEGPPSHQGKKGTLTLGGLGFMLAIFILSLIFINYDLDARYLALIVLTLSYAGIGLIDDLLKIMRQQNLGLTFWQKIISQFFCATLFVFFLSHHTPFSFLSVLFFIFIIVGCANATNLTDGLNGLLAGTGGLAFLAFGLISHRLGLSDATTFCLIASGAVFTFLYFNFPKARAFMGDVGALPIGAALAGVAIILRQELLLALIGGVFVIEALSVILQVASYKLFKRRIFKMAPLHHHFELLGFSELKIVIGFWVASGILGILGCWLAR